MFPPTPQDEGQDHEMEQLNMPVDEGYSENLQKLRTRSFETPKIRNQRTRAASLDMGITEPIREHKLERAESWDVEKYQPDSKVSPVSCICFDLLKCFICPCICDRLSFGLKGKTLGRQCFCAKLGVPALTK